MTKLLLAAGMIALASPVASQAASLASGQASAQVFAQPSDADDYPTAARADYVFACMNVNGGSQEALYRCSCSIDVIAAALPYDQYEAADTVLRMRQMPGGGYLAGEFRVQAANKTVDALREAEAEAEVRCF